MAETSFRTAHAHVLACEGGWSNHPSDPGGVTLNGVTQAVYDADRKARGLARKVLTKAMDGTAAWNAERDSIYKRRYWQPPRCDALNPGVDAAIYDYSVNSGIGRGARVLQRLVGVTEDGRVGPVTIEAANKRDARALVEAICAERLAFLKSLKTWPTFGKGWARRVADVLTYAGALAVAGRIPAAKPTETMGKGEVPESKVAKNTVSTASVGSAGGLLVWVETNPVEVAVLTALLIGVTVGVIYLINRRRRSRQETPMPGFGPLPEKG